MFQGFCVEARMFCLLFQTFDMKPENTNMVTSMVQALAQIVMRVQMLDGGEETLVAVAGMVSCKAQGGVFNSHCVQYTNNLSQY
jgi:hypothetical protein